jgi:hypothetical protein
MIEKLQAQATGVNLNAVANNEVGQYAGTEIDQHMVHTAVLARDDAGRAAAGSGNDARGVAHAGASHQRKVRPVCCPDADASLVIAQ